MENLGTMKYFQIVMLEWNKFDPNTQPKETLSISEINSQKGIPFSEGKLSPVPFKAITSNYTNSIGGNSIYNAFRRSRHKLFEIDENPGKRRKVNSISNNIEKPVEKQFYKPEESSLFVAFKKNQKQINNEPQEIKLAKQIKN